MGEEGKKPEEKNKPDEGKKAEDTKVEYDKLKEEENKKGGERGKGDGGVERKNESGKEEAPALLPLPLPEEIVMRVHMHCEGCARKVKRSLKGFDGVEEVTTDCRTHKVVVKGKKAAEDPMKVVEQVQKKRGRKVELLTPVPLPKADKKEEDKKEEKPKPEEKNEPAVVSVVLRVHMHCEACSREIKRRILKMKGVQAAEPDLKASQVTVKGILDPAKLVEYIYKRTGKHALIVKSEPADKKPEDAGATLAEGKSISEGSGGEEKKAGDGGGDEKKTEGEMKGEVGREGGYDKEKKDGGSPENVAAADGKIVELKRNELYYFYPRFAAEYHAYPPQMFSDENPNACSVM